MSQDMSSPPSSAAESDTRPASAGSSTTAFLVYSPDTLKDNLESNADNKPVARQKRRRTSPEDQKILEDEFSRNPKPDKASRLEIIKKVALGEKEIQIWFQNRRQASRRRQEPTVDSDEITASQDSRSRASSQLVPSSSMQLPTSTPPAEALDIQREDGLAEVAEMEVPEQKDAEQAESDRKEEVPVKIFLVEDSQGTAYTASMSASMTSTFPAEPSSSQTIPSSQDTTRAIMSKPGYLANRRSASFVPYEPNFITAPANPIPAPPVVPRTLVRSTSSNIRLSMTEDGHARVIDRNNPSPPRAQPVPVKSGSLRRSYSAAGLTDMFRSSAVSKFPRISKDGRSRDSRHWNFWCDPEVRNSLAETADIESAAKNGSAASAINLIRQSSRGALRSNPSKGNTPMQSQQNSYSPNKKRPGLQRASTTHGRIQQPGKKGEVDVWEQANTDSDKENWEPDDARGQSQVSRRNARPHASNARGRQVLGENTQVLSQSGSLGAMMNRERKGKSEIDAEVQAFMGTAQAEPGGKTIGDELDCVASLLSLSKGNWK